MGILRPPGAKATVTSANSKRQQRHHEHRERCRQTATATGEGAERGPEIAQQRPEAGYSQIARPRRPPSVITGGRRRPHHGSEAWIKSRPVEKPGAGHRAQTSGRPGKSECAAWRSPMIVDTVTRSASSKGEAPGPAPASTRSAPRFEPNKCQVPPAVRARINSTRITCTIAIPAQISAELCRQRQ